MKISLTRFLAGCSFAAAFLFFVSCSTARRNQQSQQPAVAVTFSADTAYAFCAAQCAFGPRIMNSEAHDQCAQWIAGQFQRYGCRVDLQHADLRGYDGTTLRATNIIARSPQQSPLPRILLCAHWDSRPWADNDPDSANWRKPVMAANDGASGVAVMLEVARLLQQHDSARVAVDFVCFDAEDWGVPQWSEQADADSWALGAQHWAANPAPLRPADYQYAILLDMVGGQGARFYREGFSMQHARAVVEKVWQAAAAAGYASVFPNADGGYVTDDHVPLNEVAHIPTIDIINHYPDCEQSSFGPVWHTVSDDMQHIDRNTLQAVGQTLVQLIYSH
ncbi:MAG: M28 family peptidase [Prevotella sp.]|nr:M28 family peptidase [Prevotella sp.]